MKKIKIYDYEFNVDVNLTKQYYKRNTICDCAVCENFYETVQKHYPKLDDFLKQFGVKIKNVL